MARIKVFAEFEALVDMELEGVDAGTPEHEVQQHRAEVRAMLEDHLHAGFGGENPRKLVNFEFDVERE